MKFRILLLLPLSLMFGVAAGQQVDSLYGGPSPRQTLSKIAIEYYKIDFTPAQRSLLDRRRLELIYSVDTMGVATLEDVNGLQDKSIFDSLSRTTSKLLPFRPERINGHPVESVYSIMLEYPSYRTQVVGPPYQQFSNIASDSIETSERMDIIIGAVMNGYLGNASDYLRLGGGMKVDVVFAGKRGYGFGLVMSFYGHDKIQDYPVASTRVQNKSSVVLLIGAAVDKYFLRKKRSEMLVQLELAYALQNVSSSLNNGDKDYIKFSGFSPGATFHYMLQIGKGRSDYYYFRPTVYKHYINFHCALRPVLYDSKSASGLMWELGVSYRLGYHFLN